MSNEKQQEQQSVKQQLSLRWIEMYRTLFKLQILDLNYCKNDRNIKTPD